MPPSRTRVLLRFLASVYVLAPVAFVQIRDRRRFLIFGGRRELNHQQREKRAEKVADAFERLGTTYIKLAQFLTTRPDLVPPVYVRAMERLQDEVPPEDFEEIRRLLQDEIGDPHEVYDSFDEEALSGASIAQVHRAVLDGDDVVLKIRRPGLEERVDTDLRVIGVLAPLVRRLFVRMGQESHAESAKNIVEELEKTIHEEMDFDREAAIMTEIRENFERDGLDERVIVPYAYPEYSTERVITMEYVEGIAVKHTDEIREKGHDVEEIVDAIADAYLHMAFRHDVFHADPHQGNLAVAPDGRAVIYDYGIAQRPPEEIQEKWTRMFMGVGMRDPGMVVDALEDMDALDESIDRSMAVEVAEMMIRDVSGAGIEEAEMQRIEREIDEKLYDYPMRFPRDIILGMRATFGLDGLCADLAPEYNFSRKLFEFFVEEMDPKEVPELSRMGEGTEYRVLERLDTGLGRFASLSLPLPYLDTTRPVTALLLDNHRRLDRFGIDVLRQPYGIGDEDERTKVTLDTEDLNRTVTDEMKRKDRRVLLSVVGASFVLSGASLYVADSALAPYSAGVGAFSFLLAWRSFKETKRGVMGPKYVATRHRIEQWEDEDEETDAEG
jgi:predicted unusual protein kinase regulating ubiquinone biosynthesis (AarF/ABC1/UbiB family)